MPQTNINIRMDENLKRDFESVCAEIGLTMTAAFNIFAKVVSNNREIPFKLSANRTLEQAEEWGHLSSGKLFTVAETAGMAREWANSSSIFLESKSPWAKVAVEKEIRIRKDQEKNGIAGH